MGSSHTRTPSHSPERSTHARRACLCCARSPVRSDPRIGALDPDWQTALKVWTAYLNLMPEKDFAYLNLARVHLNLGDAGNARACLARVANPANERLKNRLEERIQAELSAEKTPASPEVEKSSKPGIDEGRLAP